MGPSRPPRKAYRGVDIPGGLVYTVNLMGYTTYIEDSNFHINADNYAKMNRDMQLPGFLDYHDLVFMLASDEPRKPCPLCAQKLPVAVEVVGIENQSDEPSNYELKDALLKIQEYIEKPAWVELMSEEGDRSRLVIGSDGRVYEVHPELVWPD